MTYLINRPTRNLFVALLATSGFSLTAWADPFAYVANSNSGNVSVIDVASNTVVATVPVGTSPRGVAITPEGSLVYVANLSSNDVSVIETLTNTVVAEVSVGTLPNSVTITPDGKFAYVANQSGSVSVIETTTQNVSATIPLGFAPFDLAITPDGSFVYVADFGNSISVIDTATNTVSSSVTIGNGPQGIAITPDGRFAYLTSTFSGEIIVIDTTTNTSIATIPVPGPSKIQISPDGKYVYVIVSGMNKVYVIDTTTNTVTKSLLVGQTPAGVAFTPDGNFAYVSARSSDRVAVIDTAIINVIATIAVGDDPTGIAITPGVNNEKPTANAGLDLAFRAGDIVSLDGGASFDDNTDASNLIYEWNFSLLPMGSTTALAGADTAMPSFVADVAGNYEVSLVVTDEGGLSSDADLVNVSSENLAPTAAAGDDQLVIISSNVGLDGSASGDPENDPLTFNWTLTTPVSSSASLSDASNSTPTFTPDVEGVYSAELAVSDFLGAGVPDTVEIVATTADSFAETQIVDTEEIVSELPETEVTTQGNQSAFSNFMSQATIAIQADDTAAAIDKLEKAISRTDGCALRGSPDANGQGRDWITSCDAQAPVYAALNDALDALTMP